MIRSATTSPCTPRTTRWSTPTFAGDDPQGRVRRRQGHDLGPRHLRVREVGRPRGQGRPARRTRPGPLRPVPDRRRQLDDPPHGPARAPRRRPDARAGQADARDRRRAAAAPRTRTRWAFEMKWDGVRAVVYVDHGSVRVAHPQRPRGGVDLPRAARPRASSSATARWSSTARSWRSTSRAGPASAPSSSGCTCSARTPALRDRVPVTYLAFDVLYLRRASALTSKPYAERRAAARVPRPGRTALGDAARVRRRRCRRAGRVAGAGTRGRHRQATGRRPTSPAGAARRWIKVKHLRTQEVVIGGWKAGEGRRTGGIGSLLLGVHDEEGRLRFAGHVGTGFTNQMLDDLAKRLQGAGAQDLARSTTRCRASTPRTRTG